MVIAACLPTPVPCGGWTSYEAKHLGRPRRSACSATSSPTSSPVHPSSALTWNSFISVPSLAMESIKKLKLLPSSTHRLPSHPMSSHITEFVGVRLCVSPPCSPCMSCVGRKRVDGVAGRCRRWEGLCFGQLSSSGIWKTFKVAGGESQTDFSQ